MTGAPKFEVRSVEIAELPNGWSLTWDDDRQEEERWLRRAAKRLRVASPDRATGWSVRWLEGPAAPEVKS